METPMEINSAVPADTVPQSDTVLRRFLGGTSIFTLVMTVPQVWTIWIDREAAGVSILSWGAYLLSAVLWFWFGLKQGDKNIYLPCIGWMALNGAVVVGAIVYG
jgi:uncharacterized protein with PQ loop repeat